MKLYVNTILLCVNFGLVEHLRRRINSSNTVTFFRKNDCKKTGTGSHIQNIHLHLLRRIF